MGPFQVSSLLLVDTVSAAAGERCPVVVGTEDPFVPAEACSPGEHVQGILAAGDRIPEVAAEGIPVVAAAGVGIPVAAAAVVAAVDTRLVEVDSLLAAVDTLVVVAAGTLPAVDNPAEGTLAGRKVAAGCLRTVRSTSIPTDPHCFCLQTQIQTYSSPDPTSLVWNDSEISSSFNN